jgi:hypothetical protein
VATEPVAVPTDPEVTSATGRDAGEHAHLSPQPNSARGAAVNALAVATVAVSTGGQVALYLAEFGATHRTDGLIAAFAVYSLMVVVGQLMRTTAVPVLSRVHGSGAQIAFGWAVASLAVAVAIVCAAVAEPLGHVLAHASGPAGRRIAVASLYVLAPAMGLQIAGAGLAVKGAVSGRIEQVAFAYMASALAGLVAFFAVRGAAQEVTLAWTMLTSSVVLTVGLALGTRFRPARPPRGSRVRDSAIAIAGSLPLPACFIVMYPLTLALLPHQPAGQITLFGLAYGACSYLVGFTGQALSMTDAVVMSRQHDGGVARRRALVTRSFRYSLLVAAAGVGVAAVCGSPVLGRLLPATSDPTHSLFSSDVLWLIPWLIATLALWAVIPAVLSATGGLLQRRQGAVVGGLLVIHVIAMLVGREIGGIHAMIVGMAVAPALFVAAGLHTTVPGAARDVSVSTAVTIVGAAVSFGIPYAIGRTVAGTGAVVSVACAIVGVAVYGVVIATCDRSARATIVSLLRRHGTAATAARDA